MRVAIVGGARPNFMKVAPVLTSLEDCGMDVLLVHSGQHYDASMSDVFFEELGIRRPDVNLGIGSGTHTEQTAGVMIAFDSVVVEWRPEVVVVVGDVNSTVACGLVAAKAGCRLAHVEAGLRSRDWRMPEEINRVVTDRLSDLLFTPSEDATENLRREGYRPDQIHTVGNVMVDTLLHNLERARGRTILRDLGLEDSEFGLVTLHRPSNVDDPDALRRLLDALERVSELCPLVFPVHPRTRRQLENLTVGSNIQLLEPLGYLDFVALEASARLVLTDSGGVQEETTMLGVPCLTLRETTERPVTVEQGSNTVVGTDANRIVAAAEERLRSTGPYPRPDLWDGKASQRIAAALNAAAESGWAGRPTDLA